MPVETGGDVLEELVPGVASAEVGDLALEVGSLVLGGDSSVEESRFLLRESGMGAGVAAMEEELDVADVVEVLAAGGDDRLDAPLGGAPADQGLSTDPIAAGDGRRGDEAGRRRSRVSRQGRYG